MAPPATPGRMSQYIVRGAPRTSFRNPYAAAADAGHSATVFVALARIGPTPTNSSAGNVITLPPPAIEFTTPPAMAAPNSASSCQTCDALNVIVPVTSGRRSPG